MTALSALAKYTTLDYDFNVLALSDWPEKLFKETFQDCTSNQALVYNGITSSVNQKNLVTAAVKEAKELVESGAEGAKGRKVEEVAIDIMAIKLALPIFAHLQGFIHSQTSVLAANSLEGTLTHAHALIALYKHYGIPPDRLCLKIPSTVEGLQACKKLQEAGQNTLATVVHSAAQIVASGEAGCTYVAPYINPLAVHFTAGSWEDLGPHGLQGYTVAARGQRTLADRGYKTKVMAASIVTSNEALCLAGLSHSTLSPSVLLSLASAPITSDQEALIQNSVEFFDKIEPYSEEVSFGTNYDKLRAALEEEPGKGLVANALKIFGEFEEKLLELARNVR